MTVYVTDDWNKIDIINCLQKFKKSSNKSMRFDYSDTSDSVMSSLIMMTCSEEGFNKRETGCGYLKIYKESNNETDDKLATNTFTEKTLIEKTSMSEALTAFMSALEEHSEWMHATKVIDFNKAQSIYLSLMKKVSGIN